MAFYMLVLAGLYGGAKRTCRTSLSFTSIALDLTSPLSPLTFLKGYKNVMENCMKNTRFLREGLQKLSQPLKMLAAFRVSVHHFCSEIVTVDQSFNCDGRSGIEDESLESDVDKFCEAIMDNSNAYCNMEKALDHVGLPLTTPLVVGGASRASF